MTIREVGHEALGTADQRRVQMLQAALEVIAERGYAETRIADVAERAGVSPALVIYYWYAVGRSRIASLPTAAARLQEFVAMACLAESDPLPSSSWQLWLDVWAQAARNDAVAGVRQKSDERWRAAIAELVREGQAAGEFREIDTDGFAISLSALLDGLTVQIALDDPVVDRGRAFDLTMRFVAEQLGFTWSSGRALQVADQNHHSGTL
jgi:hypothetical protein